MCGACLSVCVRGVSVRVPASPYLSLSDSADTLEGWASKREVLLPRGLLILWEPDLVTERSVHRGVPR